MSPVEDHRHGVPRLSDVGLFKDQQRNDEHRGDEHRQLETLGDSLAALVHASYFAAVPSDPRVPEGECAAIRAKQHCGQEVGSRREAQSGFG